MKRKLTAPLMEWDRQGEKEPLLILGAKNTGKTSFILDYIRENRKNGIYLNFENDPQTADFFEGADEKEVLDGLRRYFHMEEGEYIVVLDEIKPSGRFFALVERLSRLEASISFVLLSSFVGAFRRHSFQLPESYTVLFLYPMDFDEFLEATGNEWYVPVIQEHFASLRPVPEIVHEELLTLFDRFLETGGMPGAVAEYLTMGTAANIPEKHKMMELMLLHEIQNSVSGSEYLKICQVFRTVDRQLAKKNKKFQYRLIRKGAAAGQFGPAIRYLEETQLLLPSVRLDDAMQETDSFKLYLLDWGMLLSKARAGGLCRTEEEMKELKKGILENYVGCSLHSRGNPLYFWESGSGARIDFILKKPEGLIPVEVWTEDYTRSRSVGVFREKQSISRAVKLSARNFRRDRNTYYYPCYAIFCM